MKAVFCAFALALVTATAASAPAKTASKTISATVTVVSGNSVSAYMTGGTVETIVRHNGSSETPPSGVLPLLSIGFDLPSSGFLVKRVTWDKHNSHLTIDF